MSVHADVAAAVHWLCNADEVSVKQKWKGDFHVPKKKPQHQTTRSAI